MIHIGTEYGGWSIPEDVITDKSICYLVGSGEDISFDIGLSKKYYPMIYVFDPTPRAKKYFYQSEAVENKRMVFYPFGLFNKDGRVKFFPPKIKEHCSYSIDNIQKTLDYIWVTAKQYSTLMKNFGHKKVDMLKLDVEGAEYEILSQMLLTPKTLPTLLLVEFHDNMIDDDSIKNNFLALKEKLLKYYTLLIAKNGDYTYQLKEKTKTKKRKLLIIQPKKAGDIIRCLPIAEHYSVDYDVYWLCDKQYRDLFNYVDYATAVSKKDGKYDKVIDLSFGFDDKSEIHNKWVREREWYDSFIQFKYELAGVDVKKSFSLKLNRNISREEKLYDFVVGKKENYTLVHNVSDCGEAPVYFEVDNPVYYLKVGDYTPFDWIKIIENAKEIHAIDSSLVNLVEMLPNIKAKLVYYITEKVGWEYDRTLISDKWIVRYQF